MQRIGVVESAVGGPAQFASMAALFPHILFEALGEWPERSAGGAFDVLVVGADAADGDALARRLTAAPRTTRIVVVLRNADVLTTRRLVREGAADVLPHPVSEPALALSLERLLSNESSDPARRKAGEAVAILKAGGGVGATSLAVQVAALLAARDGGGVCLADLDVQFGAAALYLDMPDTVTVADLLNTGASLADTPFATALSAHPSGARVLAAPHELMALEGVHPAQMDSLLAGLRRDFALTLIDLPSAWTAWTHRVLSLVDRIVLVTQLSVPHIQLVKRQLRTLAVQKLEDRPLILVCNGPSADQQGSVSIKAAERALGRGFDVVVPEDRRTMSTAINHGLELSVVRRGTKLEKAVVQLADKVAAGVIAAPAGRARR
ncbi:AAA family ATPase [Phenylobacterium sp.]|uniref:AAA family ATPase n=1 Tax=Phenylobacterium sp. TaxID=1871053 RepID=UPI002F401D98